jgi:bile acid:Na+ symporter, BASS family
MHGSAITTIFLPLALGIIMLGLGLSLTIADFRRIIAYPRAIAVGLVCQTLLLPAVCFGVAKIFALPPELAVGLMLLSASPGGATANLFSHLAKGDVALNITLTATNSVVSLITLPFIVSASLSHFMSDGRAIPIQPDKVVQVFAVVLVPVAIGMLVRAKKKETALRLERPVRILSVVFLVLIIGAALAKDRANLGDAFAQVGLPALAFNLASLAVGYFVPRILRLPKRQAIAIGMEIGIHNGTLAIAIATTVLARDAMAIPPAIYSIIMFFTAAAFGFLVQRGEPVEEAAPRPVTAP